MDNIYRKYKGMLQRNMPYIYKKIQKTYKEIQRNSYSNTPSNSWWITHIEFGERIQMLYHSLWLREEVSNL